MDQSESPCCSSPTDDGFEVDREEECDDEECERLVREVVEPPSEDFLWLVEILEELGHRVTVLGLEVSGLDVEE